MPFEIQVRTQPSSCTNNFYNGKICANLNTMIEKQKSPCKFIVDDAWKVKFLHIKHMMIMYLLDNG